MDKTIGTKFPEEEVAILEKMASEKKETVSVLVREMIRNAIKQAGNGEAGKEENIPASDPRFEEILTLLWKLIESKCDSALAQNPDPETAKKIEEVLNLVSGLPGILHVQIQEIRNEIGEIPKSEGGGTIDVSGLKTSVGEISVLLKDAKEKAKNIGGYLGQAEEKAENILGGMTRNISLILLLVSVGFIASGYALARYTMPDIPALKKEESALKESIRVLSFQDPKKLDMSTCGKRRRPCIRIIPGKFYGAHSDRPFYPIDPIK